MGNIKSKKLSVIVPVYNSRKYIARNLEIIKKNISLHFPNNEIIAVVDGNRDQSLEQAKKVPNVKVVGYPVNQGKGYALKHGFQYVTGDYVTFLDADLDFHPTQLKNFVPYMTTADIVIGSKRHDFSKVKYPLSRLVLSKAFQIYSKMVLGVSLKDTQSGFKLMKREVLEILMPLVTVKRFAFDLELMFLAQKHGFRTVEAPIALDFHGKSAISLEAIQGMFLDVLGIRYRYSVKKYYQKLYHKTFMKK